VPVITGNVRPARTLLATSVVARLPLAMFSIALLALWGAGSLAGGVVASRLGGGARSARGLVGMLAALAAGHLALGAAAGSPVALGAVLFAAGAAIAPTYASVYAMVDDVAPAGAITEARGASLPDAPLSPAPAR
jgi:hypothetical protein